METDFGSEGVFLIEEAERVPRKDSLQDFYDMLKEEYGENDCQEECESIVIDLSLDADKPEVKFVNKKERKRRIVGDIATTAPPTSADNAQEGTNNARKKRKKGAKPGWTGDVVAQFYTEMLSWDVSLLSSFSLKLPISEVQGHYKHASQFYDHCRELVMEETAHNIGNGLRQINKSSSLTLRYVGDASKQKGEIMLLAAEVVYGSADLTRPGSCFVIYPHKCNYPKFNFSAPAYTGINKGAQGSKTGIFGAIAPNREAALTKRVPMYVHESLYTAMAEDGMLQNGTMWVAYEVCNVITAQRMAAVCSEQPKASFISKIQGGKLASHIKFDDEGSGSIVPGRSFAAAPKVHAASISGIVPGKSLAGKPSVAAARHGFSRRLNESQLGALDDVVRNTCGPPVREIGSIEKKGTLSLVQGPPGCGKSTFLTALLEELVLLQNKRVLACAPSNKAVCVLLDKFLAMKEQDPAHASCDRNIVLIGVEDKLDKNIRIRNRSSSDDLLSSTQATDKNTSLVTGRLNGVPSSLCGFSERTVEALRTITNPQSAFDLFAYRLGDHFCSAFRGLSSDLNAFLGRLGLLSDSDVRSHMNDIKTFISSAQVHFESVVNRMRSACPRVVQREIESYYETISSHLVSVLMNFSQHQYDESIGESTKELLLDASTSLLEVSNFLSTSDVTTGIAAEVLSNADVIFCTLSCSGQSIMKRVPNIDVMVVDEAAQALEPELCISFSLFPEHLVLVGDPCQLSATLLSPRAQQLGRGDSTMKRLMNFCDRPFHLLSTQYRMHPQLSQFPNREFYKSRISDSAHVTSRTKLLSSAARSACPIPWLADYAFIDVHGKENNRDGMQRFSTSNAVEALFIARLLVFLAVSYPHIDVSSQVCVITFYAGQVTAILNAIKSLTPKVADAHLAAKLCSTKVITVDSFQGSETDIVILSFVRSNANNNVGFLSDFSRINVAITRAKHNLFCIGDANTLENCKLDYLRRIVKDAKSRSKFFSGTDISGVFFKT